MILIFSTVIIFVFFEWHPNALGLNVNVGAHDFICRSVLKRDPRTESNVLDQSSGLKCWTVRIFDERRQRQCVLKILNTTREYLYFTNLNCEILNSRLAFNCILFRKEARYYLNSTWTIFQLPSNNFVLYVNSTGIARNSINSSSNRFNDYNTASPRRHSNLNRVNVDVFICNKQNEKVGQKKNKKSWQRVNAQQGNVFGKIFVRNRRNILGNFSGATAFSKYFHSQMTMTREVALSTSAQSPVVTVPMLSNLCPRSVVVNRSTIYITPTLVAATYVGSSVSTQKRVSTHFRATPMLRPTTLVGNTTQSSFSGKPTATFVLNSTSTWIVAHSRYRSMNATFRHHLGSLQYITQGSAFIASVSCATVSQLSTTSRESSKTPTSRTTTTDKDDTTHKTLYLGLIAGGGAVLFIIICIAMFLLVRRYRRVKALRREAKQISYFNKFDCSLAWDEPDRFGGSKLSVFTLKNSKFDIDWESTNDTKQ